MSKRLFSLAVLLAVFFVFAYTAAFAGSAKVVICHHNADDPDEPEWVTIEVSENAVPAHLAHGDILGACVVEEPVPVP